MKANLCLFDFLHSCRTKIPVYEYSPFECLSSYAYFCLYFCHAVALCLLLKINYAQPGLLDRCLTSYRAKISDTFIYAYVQFINIKTSKSVPTENLFTCTCNLYYNYKIQDTKIQIFISSRYISNNVTLAINRQKHVIRLAHNLK